MNIPQPPFRFLKRTTIGPDSGSIGFSGANKLIGYNPDWISSTVRNGDNFSQQKEHPLHGTSTIGSSVVIDVKFTLIIFMSLKLIA